MSSDIYIPGIGQIKPEESGPSVGEQLILQQLAEMTRVLNVVSLQLDLLLRMESNETPRSEIKSRIRRADEIMREQRAQENGQRQEASHEVDATLRRVD